MVRTKSPEVSVSKMEQDGGSTSGDPDITLDFMEQVKGMTKDQVQAYITELCADDESLKPLLDELFQDASISLETLIEVFKETWVAALQLRLDEDEDGNTVDQEKDDKKESKKTKAEHQKKQKQSQRSHSVDTHDVVKIKDRKEKRKDPVNIPRASSSHKHKDKDNEKARVKDKVKEKVKDKDKIIKSTKTEKNRHRDPSSNSSSSSSSSSSSDGGFRTDKKSSKPITGKAKKRKLISSDDDLNNSDASDDLMVVKKKHKTASSKSDNHHRSSTSIITKHPVKIESSSSKLKTNESHGLAHHHSQDKLKKEKKDVGDKKIDKVKNVHKSRVVILSDDESNADSDDLKKFKDEKKKRKEKKESDKQDKSKHQSRSQGEKSRENEKLEKKKHDRDREKHKSDDTSRKNLDKDKDKITKQEKDKYIDQEKERKVPMKERKESEKERKHPEKEKKDPEKEKKDPEKEKKDPEKERKHPEKEKKDPEKERKHSENETKDPEKERKHSENETKDPEKEFKDPGKERKDSENERKDLEKERVDSENGKWERAEKEKQEKSVADIDLAVDKISSEKATSEMEKSKLEQADTDTSSKICEQVNIDKDINKCEQIDLRKDDVKNDHAIREKDEQEKINEIRIRDCVETATKNESEEQTKEHTVLGDRPQPEPGAQKFEDDKINQNKEREVEQSETPSDKQVVEQRAEIALELETIPKCDLNKPVENKPNPETEQLAKSEKENSDEHKTDKEVTNVILTEKVKVEKPDVDKDKGNKAKAIEGDKMYQKVKFERFDPCDKYSSNNKGKDKETKNKLKIGGMPYIHPEYQRYRKKFKLRQCKVVLYDLKKQDAYWREGDKIYRAKLREEKRQRSRHHGNKHEKYEKYPEKKEKYSERGTRILPFEKRPENSELYGRKREIIREKAKTEQKTEHQKQLEALHRKEKEKERETRAMLNLEFRIPKDKRRQTHHNIQDHSLSSSTPLAPAVQPSKMRFDTKRLVTSAHKNDTWQMTPEEERILRGDSSKKKVEPLKVKAELDAFDVQDDEGLPDTANDDGDGFAPDGFDDDDLLGNADGSEANPVPESGALPLSSPEDSDLAKAVRELLDKETNIQVADEGATAADVIVRKCGKWFEGIGKEPYYQSCPSIPENKEEEYYTLISVYNDDDDDSFFGNVSNPDGEDDVQDNEITSTARDPDVADEHCGQGLVHSNARLRVKPGEDKDCFISILNVRRGCNYDKQNFQAKCNLCDEFITSKRHLGAHIRGNKHRTELINTSLKHIGMEGELGSKKADTSKLSSPSHDSLSLISSKSNAESGRDKDKSKAKDDKDDKSRDRKEKDKEGNEKKKDERDKNGLKSGVDKNKSQGKSGGSVSSHSSTSERKRGETGRSGRRRSKSRSPGISRSRRSRSRGRRSRSRSRGRRSRSRSRSPFHSRKHRRSRSRSPKPRSHKEKGGHRSRSRSRSPTTRRRRSSFERIDEFLAKNERSARRVGDATSKTQKNATRTKQDDNMIFHEKLQLQATGKWTAELEGRWKLKDDDEEVLKKVTNQKRKMLEERPEDHPQYGPQWEKFWETRYQQVQDSGKNPDTHDYTSEWKIFWGILSEELLQEEYDSKLHEVRKKYGMDLDTLRSLNASSAPPRPQTINIAPGMGVPPRFGPMMGLGPPPFIHSAAPIPQLQTLLPPGVDPVPAPAPVPAYLPHGIPVPMHGGIMPVAPVGVGYRMVPPPQFPVTMTQPPPVINPVMPAATAVLKGPGSASGRNTQNINRLVEEDYTPKAMSISDTGMDEDVQSNRSRGSGQGRSPPPKVTVDDIKSTWFNLTGQKVMEAAKSVAGSLSGSSVKSKDYDYDGFDVVQVLRLMLALEDELSFLSHQVNQFYKQAEEMELGEPRSSFSMLKDKEFVTVLFQCRDKFFAILRANVSSSDVMKKLNLAVFAMNALLDSPSCQKLRPQAPVVASTSSGALNTESRDRGNVNAKPTNDIRLPIPAPPSQGGSLVSTSSRKSDSDGDKTAKTFDNPIAAALADVPMNIKVEMSSIIASSLIAQGKDRLNDNELMSHLFGIFSPMLNGKGSKRQVPSGPGSNSSGTARGMNAGPPPIPKPADDLSIPPRATFSAIPPLPEFEARAVSPPAHRRMPSSNPNQNPEDNMNFGNFGATSYLPNPFARGGGGGGRGGWGRRDYHNQGNPIPEDQGFRITKRRGQRQIQNRERSCSPVSSVYSIDSDLNYDEFKSISSPMSVLKQLPMKSLPPTVAKLLGSQSQCPPQGCSSKDRDYDTHTKIQIQNDGRDENESECEIEYKIRIIDFSKLASSDSDSDTNTNARNYKNVIEDSNISINVPYVEDTVVNNNYELEQGELEVCSEQEKGDMDIATTIAPVASIVAKNPDAGACGTEVTLDYEQLSPTSDLQIHVDFGRVDESGSASTRIEIAETEVTVGGKEVTKASSIITIRSAASSIHSVEPNFQDIDHDLQRVLAVGCYDKTANPTNTKVKEDEPQEKHQPEKPFQLPPGILNLIRKEKMSKANECAQLEAQPEARKQPDVGQKKSQKRKKKSHGEGDDKNVLESTRSKIQEAPYSFPDQDQFLLQDQSPISSSEISSCLQAFSENIEVEDDGNLSGNRISRTTSKRKTSTKKHKHDREKKRKKSKSKHRRVRRGRSTSRPPHYYDTISDSDIAQGKDKDIRHHKRARHQVDLDHDHDRRGRGNSKSLSRSLSPCRVAPPAFSSEEDLQGNCFRDYGHGHSPAKEEIPSRAHKKYDQNEGRNRNRDQSREPDQERDRREHGHGRRHSDSSKKHHSSRREKRHRSNSSDVDAPNYVSHSVNRNEKVTGVSKNFWNRSEAGSIISSESSFGESRIKKEDHERLQDHRRDRPRDSRNEIKNANGRDYKSHAKSSYRDKKTETERNSGDRDRKKHGEPKSKLKTEQGETAEIDAEEGEILSESETDCSEIESPPRCQYALSPHSDCSEDWERGIFKYPK